MKTLKNYKKLFADYWGYCESDVPICWLCVKQVAVDIHHIENKKMGGVAGNRLNRIDNLFPLCRSCHDKVHKNKGINEKLKLILKDKIYKRNGVLIMVISVANWHLSIFLDYRKKRKEHNILNARRKSEKRLQVSQYKKKLVVQNVGIKIIQIYYISIT